MKLLIVHSNKKSPWIGVDKKILSSSYEVSELFIPSIKTCRGLFEAIRNADIVLFWFGSFLFFPSLLLAKFLRKKIVIVAGGYDVSKLPAIHYGAFQESFFSRFLRLLFFYQADRVIGVSESNVSEIKESLILKHEPNFVYLGFDRSHLPSLKEWSVRQNQVVMVSNITDEQTFKLKGFDVFLEIARMLPQVDFIHVGKMNLSLSKLPSNLRLVGEVEYNSNQFCEILNSSKILFQHSMIESFCAAVVDGGLMGCVPIVSDRFSLPEVAGSEGIVVHYGDLEALKAAIEKVLFKYSPSQLRDKYLERFSLEKRSQKLLKILKEI